jgi:hypothetical protein
LKGFLKIQFLPERQQHVSIANTISGSHGGEYEDDLAF